MKKLGLTILALGLLACNKKEKIAENKEFSVEYVSDKGKEIIAETSKIEVLADGFTWTEGSLWIDSEQVFLFSDVPENKVYQWREGKGISVYLEPSGLTTDLKHTGEMGSNGLFLNQNGELVLCQHGDRRVAVMNAPLNAPKAEYKTLASSFGGKKINSPNDIVQAKNGEYFFTDPDYGISANDTKEQEKNRVYRLNKNRELAVLVDTISHPNGLAFSPNEDRLYITNSNPEKAFLYQYQLDDNKNIVSGGVMYDFRKEWKEGLGTPDGLKIDKEGNVFTSAPGGIWVFNKEGELLIKIHTTKKVSNLSLSKDGKTMYITNSDKVLRLKMR